MLYNDSTRYKYFKIDAKDIWEYERNYYNVIEKDWTFISTLYEFIQEAFIKSGATPLQEITINPDGGTKSRLEAFKHVEERRLVLDFFIWGNMLYDLNIPCPLDKEKIGVISYQYFFAFKLRQYNGNVSSITLFLDYHLKKTFKKNIKAAAKFLEAVLLQHNKLLTQEVSGLAYKWIQALTPLKRDKYLKTEEALSNHLNQETPDFIQVLNEEILLPENQFEKSTLSLADPIQAEAEKNILDIKSDLLMPQDYFYYKGKFFDSEVQEFFSFLYLAKDKEGLSYLCKEEVQNMFQYGIAIPPAEKNSRYKLNIGGARNKKIILYAIYVFYKNYAFDTTGKRRILSFFASYLDDFAFALSSEEEMIRLGKAITGVRPLKSFFNLEKYIPVRLEERFKLS